MSILPKKIFWTACGLLLAIVARSQTAAFAMPDTACAGTIVPITNTSSGATTFRWNFCEPSWEMTPRLEKLPLPSLGWITAAAFGSQQGEHFAFVLHGAGRRSLSRLDFGNSWANNNPTITSLGDFGGLVNTNAGKDNLHLVNDNGQWFLFVVGINTNGINVAYPFVRISLGASISNTSPAAEDLTSVGGFAGPEDVAFVKEGNRWLALVVNSSIAGQLTRLDFGSSLANLPVSTLLGNLGGALVNPARIQVFNRAGSWFALVYDVPTDRVVPLLFGTSLLNTPIASQLNTPAGTSNAVYVRGCSNELLAISYTSISAPQFRSSFYSEALGFIRTQAFNLPSILPDLRHWKPITDSLGGYVFFSRNSLFITPPQSGDTLFRLVFGGCPGSSIPSATTMVPPPVRFSAPGTYTVRLTVDAGMATEQSVCRTIVVVPGGNGGQQQMRSLCQGDSVRLQPATAAVGWRWSTGQTGASIVVRQPGLYWAAAGTACGEWRDSFEVRTLPAPPLQVNVPTIAACATDSTLLQASGALSYNWSPAQGLSSTDGPQVWAAPAADRWYTVVATGSNGCTAIDSVRVSTQISTRPPLYLVPNAFTPNADGINDCFGIRHWGRLSRLQFRIFDRWGQMVFQTSNADNCWNGRYSNGEPAPSGTYSFAIDASSNCGSIRRKGVVRLIR